MSWLSRLNRPIVYASVGILLFCFAFLQTLTLNEPPLTLSIGEYTAGNYPTGIALYQSASGHYYASSIYEDYLVINGQRQTFASLEKSLSDPDHSYSYTSVKGGSKLIMLAQLALGQSRILPLVTHQFYIPETIFVDSALTMNSSTSAQLTRNWKTYDVPGLSAGATTFKYSDADLLIDPKRNIIYVASDRALDQQLVEKQAKTTFASRGTLINPTASWQLDSDTIVILNPDSSGVLQLQAIADQKIMIHPATKTIEFVTTLSPESEKTQKILIKTWPTIAQYPWSSP